MPKVIVPVDKLPVPGVDGKHKIRFRITTKDYNEISEWSPVFILDSTGQIAGASASYSYDVVTTTSNDRIINVSWEDVHYSVDSAAHDLFIRWNYSTGYEYYGRVTGNSATIRVPISATTFRIKVQLPSYPVPPEENNIFKLFETSVITL
jgi:hypothetical protein